MFSQIVFCHGSLQLFVAVHISQFCVTAPVDSPIHNDVIKWKLFPRYWPFKRGIHRSPVNSPHKGQWRGALMFSLICVGLKGWINNREAGDLRRYRVHYDVTVMRLGKEEYVPWFQEQFGRSNEQWRLQVDFALCCFLFCSHNLITTMTRLQ